LIVIRSAGRRPCRGPDALAGFLRATSSWSGAGGCGSPLRRVNAAVRLRRRRGAGRGPHCPCWTVDATRSGPTPPSEQFCLLPPHRQTRDRCTAVGEHHRQIHHDPARVMPAAPLPQPGHGITARRRLTKLTHQAQAERPKENRTHRPEGAREDRNHCAEGALRKPQPGRRGREAAGRKCERSEHGGCGVAKPPTDDRAEQDPGERVSASA
jgi:hypothetical protein